MASFFWKREDIAKIVMQTDKKESATIFWERILSQLLSQLHFKVVGSSLCDYNYATLFLLFTVPPIQEALAAIHNRVDETTAALYNRVDETTAALYSRLDETNRELRLTREAIRISRPPPGFSRTNTTIYHHLLGALNPFRKDQNFVGDGDPFFTELERATLMNGLDEHFQEKQLVSRIYPIFLEKLLPHFIQPSSVLVNSEEYHWLPQSEIPSIDGKPDMFVSHSSIVEYKPPYAGAPATTSPIFYGNIASPNAADHVDFLFDATTQLTPAKEADFWKYFLGGLCRLQQTKVFRGMVFDKIHFVLVEFCGYALLSYCKGQWTAPGTNDKIVRFIQQADFSPLSRCIDAIMNGNIYPGLTLFPPGVPGVARESALLGAGGKGLVFHVIANGNVHQAMKLVMRSDITEIEQEFAFISEVQAVCPQAVVGVVPDSLKCSTLPDSGLSYATYLMPYVGTRPATGELLVIRGCFHSLATIHQNRKVHGDARICNCVVCTDVNGIHSYRWVDFVHEIVFFNSGAQRDIEEFLPSVRKPVPIQRILDDYLRNIASAAWRNDINTRDEWINANILPLT
jgi:hypothetical protein